jgi:hypothetical protein
MSTRQRRGSFTITGPRRAAAGQAERSAVLETGDARRGKVYRADAVFTGDERPTVPVAPKGTPQRAAQVAQVMALKAQGMTHTAISVETGMSQGTVSNLVKEGRDG